jgi:hypothetical protein
MTRKAILFAIVLALALVVMLPVVTHSNNAGIDASVNGPVLAQAHDFDAPLAVADGETDPEDFPPVCLPPTADCSGG